jgi:hypothetical protein
MAVGWAVQSKSKGMSYTCFALPPTHTEIATVESFLRHINGQVRQGEEQENLVAAAQRIGAYEVLEPSSEEVEKVRKGGEKWGQKMQGPKGSPPRKGQRSKHHVLGCH